MSMQGYWRDYLTADLRAAKDEVPQSYVDLPLLSVNMFPLDDEMARGTRAWETYVMTMYMDTDTERVGLNLYKYHGKVVARYNDGRAFAWYESLDEAWEALT